MVSHSKLHMWESQMEIQRFAYTAELSLRAELIHTAQTC